MIVVQILLSDAFTAVDAHICHGNHITLALRWTIVGPCCLLDRLENCDVYQDDADVFLTTTSSVLTAALALKRLLSFLDFFFIDAVILFF